MGGRGTSSGMNAIIQINDLRPQVEYPERVEYWKRQIQQGNDRPILVDENNLTRIIDGNHTLAAYQELGMKPKVYAMNRIEFLNGAALSNDTVDFIEDAIKKRKAKRVL